MKTYALFLSFVLVGLINHHLSAQHQVLGKFNRSEKELEIVDDAVPSKKSCVLILTSSDPKMPMNSTLYSLMIDSKSEAMELITPQSLLPFLPPTISKGDKKIFSVENLLDTGNLESLKECQVDHSNENFEFIEKKADSLSEMKDSSISSFKRIGIKFILEIVEQYSTSKSFNCKNIPEFLEELRENIAMEESLNIYKHSILENRVNKGENLTEKELKRYYELANLIEKHPSKALNFVLSSPKADDKLTSEKFKADMDNVKLTVHIKEKYPTEEIYTETLDLFIKHKWRFSFSTGIFFNGIIEDQFYINPSLSDSTANVLTLEDDRAIDLAPGALLNLQYRASKCLGLGFNIGVAVSTYDTKTRYLGGLGLAIGKKNSVVLSIGCAYSRINKISGIATKSSKKTYSIPSTLTEVPTYTAWDQSWYVGISYSVFNTK